jgi:hypothetical protein
MLGHKSRAFKQHVAISLEDLVPKENFYRQVEQCIDLSTVAGMAGHKDVQTTARYDRRPEEAQRRAARLRELPYQRREL